MRDRKTREKISNSMKGKIPWNKGKTGIYSKETLYRISNSLKGRKLSESTKEKISEKFKGRKQTPEWRENNRQSQIKRFPDYYRTEGIRERRNRRILKNGGFHTKGEWENLKAQYNYSCPVCKRNDIELTRDHIIPISRGGSNNIENIQPLCRPCNSTKHTKTIKY